METIHLSLFVILCWGVHRSSSQILQREKRNWIIDSFVINESYTGPFPYSLGKIKVENDLTLFRIHGQGVDVEPRDVLQIAEHTGEVTVHRAVDYEEYSVLKLTFQALNRDNHEIDTQLGIEIQVLDANDHAPKFSAEWYEINIAESTMQGTTVFSIAAHDSDTVGKFSAFELKIISVTPEPHDLKFFLTQAKGAKVGVLSFYGCLDHERAEKYTIVVEAKDQGDVPLSSSCTIVVNIDDGNNHSPVVTGQSGPAKVKEREEHVLLTRLQVRDEDSKGTAAWRVKYQIKGDTNDNFNITSDPETNEGLLYVKKALDYEDNPFTNLTIKIENEIAYYSCEVVQRTTTGLWKVVTRGATSGGVIGGGQSGMTLGQYSYQLTVTVEDVNEAPIFDKATQTVTVIENTVVGQYLVTFTAKDPDVISKNTFVYIKGHDPAGWVTVDSMTGKITTSTVIDRESIFVKDSIYNVTIYAVDDGKPPMTSTATLTIHIGDENDNVPTLNVSIIDICQSNEVSVANITALDLDEDPYGGPFSFKLLGDVEGKWSVNPAQGYSVNLVKEKTVNSGEHELMVEVSDRQHLSAVHKLTVTVCNCFNPAQPNCKIRAVTSSGAGGGALGIIFFSMLLLAGLLLLVFLVSCKKDPVPFPDVDGAAMKNWNTEQLGNDCKVDFEPLITPQIPQKITITEVTQKPADIDFLYQTEEEQRKHLYEQKQILMEQEFSRKTPARWTMGASSTKRAKYQGGSSMIGLITDPAYETNHFKRQYLMEQDFARANSLRWTMGASSTIRSKYQAGSSMNMSKSSTMKTIDQKGGILSRKWMRGCQYSTDTEISIHREMLLKVLNRMLYTVQAQEELSDYAPHEYAEEGDEKPSFELDAISITDATFDPDLDPDLNFKFSTLASICMPRESLVHSTATSSIVETFETMTLM